MINPWLQYILCVAILIFAGSKLTKNAAVVADNTGIGSAWIGAIMLPLATSLPELVATLRAAHINALDLAAGNIFGSCLFNLALLAVIDVVSGRGPLTARISQGHIITASLSISTICLASIAILGIVYLPVGWVGAETIGIAVIYVCGNRLLYRYEKRNPSILRGSEAAYEAGRGMSTGKALINFSLAAGLIVVAGVLVTDATDSIALATGLGHTFAGSIFLAISTSLPETVTTLSAVRLGYINMAVANVFGANFMNLFLIFIADLFYRPSPLLYSVSGDHLVSACMIVLLSTAFIFGIIYKSEKSMGPIGFDIIFILVGYFTAAYLLFRSGGN